MNTARNPRTGEFMPDTPASHMDAAKDNLGEAKDAIAAGEARLEIDDKLQSLLDKGREMLGDAEQLIRDKPLPAFGVAFAAGYLLAALTRRK